MKTDSKIIAKEVKDGNYTRNVLFIMYAELIMILCLVFVGVQFWYQDSNGVSEQPLGWRYEKYESYARDYSKDEIIVRISEMCSGDINPVECVFDEINEPYDDSRVGKSTFPPFRSPEDYFELGGVCRDVSVLRKSALKNLGIDCMFDFSEENHVFLNCYYEDKLYILDNGWMWEDGA